MAKKKPRKIAVVGTAQSSVHAPIDDKSYEIWGVGYRGDHITRCDRWFEIHRLDGLRDGPEWRPLLRKWAKDCEMVMFWPEPLGPRIMQYPVEEIKNRFGTYFMTSSLSWMVALAIHEHTNGNPVSSIGVWGVDMEFGTEYREQRSGLRHFLALARELGIPTELMVNGGLTYEPVPYPFWQDDPLLQKLVLRRGVAENEMIQKQRALDASTARVGQVSCAIAELRNFRNTGERIKKLEREAEAMSKAEPDLRRDVGYYQGAVEEIDWQMDYLKP